MGTHLRVLIESIPMNINMIGLRWFSEIFASLCFWMKVASALIGLNKDQSVDRILTMSHIDN